MRRPLIYMACHVAPTSDEIARIDASWVVKQIGPRKRAEMIRLVIESNLRLARRWLRWFSINVPQWVVIAPWIAAVQSVLEAGAEERTERAREMVVCREVARRCAAVAQVGGRVSSGMADEGAAAPQVVDLTALGEEPPTGAESEEAVKRCLLAGAVRR